MSLAIVSAGVGIATAGYSVYNSAHKASQAKKLATSNVRPIYKPDGSIEDVYNLNAANLNDDRLLDYSANQAQQGLSSGIDAILKSGGRADFQTVNNNYGSEIKQIIAQSDARRDARTAAFNNAAYNKAQSNDAAFQYNQDAPYKDLKQQEAVLRQQAEQAKMDAISTAAGTLANYGTMTTQPGQYGTTPSQENRQINSQIDNRLAIDSRNPVGTSNPDLITPVAAQPNVNVSGANNGVLQAAGRGSAAATTNTEGYIDGKIIDFDVWGNPIYG